MHNFFSIFGFVAGISAAVLGRVTAQTSLFRLSRRDVPLRANVLGAWAVAILAANIFEMRRRFSRDEATLAIHTHDMADHAFRVAI